MRYDIVSGKHKKVCKSITITPYEIRNEYECQGTIGIYLFISIIVNISIQGHALVLVLSSLPNLVYQSFRIICTPSSRFPDKLPGVYTVSDSKNRQKN